MGGIKILKLTNRFLKKEEEQSLNEFLNVKNIKENFLYTLDGQVIQFIKVEPINIELLTDDELESKMNFSSIEFSECICVNDVKQTFIKNCSILNFLLALLHLYLQKHIK